MNELTSHLASYICGSSLLRMNKCNFLSLPRSLGFVEFINKPIIVTRSVRHKHFGEYVALAIGLDAKVAGKSINILGPR